jgi:hypothetical protein
VEGLIGALGQLGPIGLALIILVIMWALNRQSSKTYREQLDAYKLEIARLNAAHDEELAELRTEMRSLRDDIKVLRAELEAERFARRAAEELAHTLRMGGSNE